ncbi:hypothetical protein LIER_22432 [Lithospermum erythrorhizon]|uniref:Retrotransposon gag domain-containing protein n=1 Tax=Lithospermum erythrorhizon TaxID=34254 RepID=A0AAV3QV40_LITER
MLKFKTFSGINDPNNHLKFFDSQLFFGPDAVDLFMDKFGASIVADGYERTLMEIQQKPGEMLRSYATRFEEVPTNIPTTNEKVTMISFFHGLRYGPLKEKLLKPPVTRNELSKLVIQYIKLEEVRLLFEKMVDARDGSPKKGKVWDRLQKSKDNFSLKRPRLRSPRLDDERALRRHLNLIGTRYTPLKAPAEIEKLIKRGQLREFVKNDQRGSARRYKEPFPQKYVKNRSPHVTGRVDTISGGIAGGGDNSNARRKFV